MTEIIGPSGVTESRDQQPIETSNDDTEYYCCQSNSDHFCCTTFMYCCFGCCFMKHLPKYSLYTAYCRWLFLGIFGFHHLYLNRWGHFVLFASLWLTVPPTTPYSVMLIFVIVYWLIDAIRIPYFVDKLNHRNKTSDKYRCIEKWSILLDIYELWTPPCSLAGFHHFFMGNNILGFVYLFSFGGFGVGWIVDALYLIPFYYYPKFRDGDLPIIKDKNMFIAYLAWLPCGGWVGLHQFYVGDIGLALVYSLTLGLWGIGWLIDAFRVPFLVKNAESTRAQERIQPPNLRRFCCICWGCKLRERSMNIYYSRHKKRLFEAYICWLSSFGILGLHHLYLQDYWSFFAHWMSLGGFGIGWVVDAFRMKYYVERANERRGNKYICPRRDIMTAYLLWLPPFGLTGVYDMYLGHIRCGSARFLTLNFLTLGWIYDGFYMHWKVEKCNLKIEQMSAQSLNQRIATGQAMDLQVQS
eukprot:377410_1